ncbi:MAG: aldehyde dehydrogenase family protein, partial [Flavobacteriales bacterium]|nr:aldehyde dehydrogenase family protein [Flavobacteriales bacterium]
YLKKSVLELGGSDAYIIDSEVDIDNAIQKTLASRILNSGQSCIGAKRIIVHKDIFDLFTSKFKKELMLYGITNESFHKIAPLARKDLRDEVHQQVSASISEGALLEMGGFIPEGSGYYYPPTLLVNVDEHMTAFKDEIFGPVFSMIQANSWDHAIQLANNTPFGLGAAIFSKDEEKARNAAERIIHSGSCAINDYVRSDPRLPFGGIGVSGFGRELASYGLLEFTNIKTICIGH